MKDLTTKAADNIRILAASMVEKAKSGHPGGAMGGADFVNILYSEFLRYNPDDSRYPFRDRFFLDPGHMSPMLYSVLALAGYFNMDELAAFRQWGSPTPGHPEVDLDRGIENTSGPLGQGHAMALGAAIAERFLVARFGDWMAHKTYAFISDGGIQEEVSQGVGRIAGHLGLSNLIMFYDSNNIQLSTKVEEVSTEDIVAKYEAWGWSVISIDGNDPAEIRQALSRAVAETEKPTLIVGHTLMGKGAVGKEGEDFSNKVSTHGQPLSAAGGDIAKTVAALGGDPENPFVIFDDVKELYARRREELKKWYALRREEESIWRAANKEQAAELDLFLSGKTPAIDYSQINCGDNVATRAASAAVLSYLAEHVQNMVVASADLSNSDKTDGFLKKTHAMRKGDFTGRFLQPGVAEFTMACIMNGMALHGGVIPACGTFFVFSDYCKPAMRLAALMNIPVTYIMTHDSIGVGEDGPTHEPVEQLIALRSIPGMKVYRPADGKETAAAWISALTGNAPTCLVLTRQNLPQYENSGLEALKGGYILADSDKKTPDVLLIASGSEVEQCMQAKVLLKEKGVDARVVSMPCIEEFEKQSRSYQDAVLPPHVRARVCVEAGSPYSWYKYAGDLGEIIAMNTFGASAPAGKLFEMYGFTAENVVEKAFRTINKQ